MATMAVVGQSCNLLRRYAVLCKQPKKVVEWNTCAGWLGIGGGRVDSVDKQLPCVHLLTRS